MQYFDAALCDVNYFKPNLNICTKLNHVYFVPKPNQINVCTNVFWMNNLHHPPYGISKDACYRKDALS